MMFEYENFELSYPLTVSSFIEVMIQHKASLVQKGSLGENRAMRKAIVSLFFILVAALSFAEDQTPVRVFLPSQASAAVYPVDKVIGQTCPSSETEAHKALFSMLCESYSFEWTESHIAEQVRSAIVRLFGAWLSDNLGESDYILSVANANSDGSYGINVRSKDSCMAFVLKDDQIISMRQL